ncbi:hypothetical protein NDU88_001278 [Pleurodeles waltl]|uniref:Uncharacterized protein n=1 Tax=Pleurodeles waltl TaxID=8319 RepID=A0AAV7USC2_PLEWA|nr:hypothetical protein NDU88_001278 [Pleurodeles waltl]
MILAPRPCPPYESGRDEGLHFPAETPRIGVPLTGFWPEAASFLYQGRRLLFLSCFRGPHLEAAFGILRTELEEDNKATKDHSKYSSNFLGGSGYMTPVKLRIRASSRVPPLVPSKKVFFSVGKGEEALQKSTTVCKFLARVGSGNKRLQVKELGKSNKGSLSVPPLSDLEPRKRQ